MTDPRRLIAVRLVSEAARDYRNQESVSSEFFLLGMLDLAVETHLLSVNEGMAVLKWMRSGDKPELVLEVEEEDHNGSSES